MTRVAVVIPNWNGERWLPGCLDSLTTQTRPADEVIVIDNGSTDASAALMRERYPWVTLIELRHNTGFAFACNRGVSEATGADHVALINTDVVLEPEWLERVVAALGDGVGSVACKMVDLDDPSVIYDAGDLLRRDGASDQRGRFLPDDGRWDTPGPVFGACAGAALYRRDAFLGAGGFDERFFMYLEDVDLALKLRLLGWECVYEPRAVAKHAGGGSGGAIPKWVERNTLLIVAKYFPLRWLPLVAYRQLGWARAAAGDGSLGAFASGVREALPLLPRYALRERGTIRRAAVVPIEDAIPSAPVRGPSAAGYEAAQG